MFEKRKTGHCYVYFPTVEECNDMVDVILDVLRIQYIYDQHDQIGHFREIVLNRYNNND
jgi:hypothetical protein